MPSALPTSDSLSKAVNSFGLGTYDGQLDDTGHGEDDETSLNSATPGVPDSVDYEPYIGYPQSETTQGKHASFQSFIERNRHLSGYVIKATSILPNDSQIPPKSSNPNDKTKGGVLAPTDVTSGQNSELPNDKMNPAARSDYFDTMQLGSIDDIWPSEDSGAYVSAEESIPTEMSNFKETNNNMSPFGNSDSGFVTEDQQVPRGFPSDDYEENSDFPKSNDDLDHGGTLVATESTSMRRVATDIPLVQELTKKFLKDHGKKNITRRAVTAFLQAEGYGDRQYVASDIVRYLKHEHDIIVPDVLDRFPVRTASSFSSTLSSIHSQILDLEVQHLNQVHISCELGSCAAKLDAIINLLSRETKV